MALLLSTVMVKTEAVDEFLSERPPVSAPDSVPAAVKSKVHGDIGPVVDDIDHLSLKERMQMLLVVGVADSSSVSRTGGIDPACLVDAAVKEEVHTLEDLSMGSFAHVESSIKVVCTRESKKGGHSTDAGQEESYANGIPDTNTVEIPTNPVPGNSCEAALPSSKASNCHDKSSYRDGNLQETKANIHTFLSVVPCTEAKDCFAEVDTNSHNSDNSLITPCTDGAGGFSCIQVKNEIQDESDIDQLDHISLQERCRMLFSSRVSGLVDFFDSKYSQISETCALKIDCLNPLKRKACEVPLRREPDGYLMCLMEADRREDFHGLQQEVSLRDVPHLVKDGQYIDSKFMKERDHDDKAHETSIVQSNGFEKSNMHKSQTNAPICSDVDVGKEQLHSALSSFPIQVKVENIENGLIGSCKNVSDSSHADILEVKVKMETVDEFHVDELDHLPLLERMKMLVSSGSSNLDFSQGLYCIQHSDMNTLEHEPVGLADVKASGITICRRKKQTVKSLETPPPQCPPGYNPIVSVKSEANCLTLPWKRKQIARHLREKALVPCAPDCDPIDSRTGNAKASRFTLRHKRKKTITDSVETALEEDAPGLLQVLAERGIKVDELKLYGDAEDEGALDISDNEDGFAQLETVISKALMMMMKKLFDSVDFVKVHPRPDIYSLGSGQSNGDGVETFNLLFLFLKGITDPILTLRLPHGGRIVLERPEYGYATYFFEMVESIPINWQIKRLVTTMKLTSFSRMTLIENKPLLVGDDLTEGEAQVLGDYGWIPNTGLGTMLRYCDRVVHDRKNEGDISEWRCKIGKLLMSGYDGGSVVLSNLPKKIADFNSVQNRQMKLELEAEML